MKIIIIGATGTIGRAVVDLLAPDHDIVKVGFRDGVKVIADINGLSPGEYGFHIHEFGDCSAFNGKSAGGHFNPDGTPHGAQTATAKNRHVGDLGNITAINSGKAHLELVDSMLAFDGAHSVIGRGVSVHADKDDLTSQPTGAAGSRALRCHRDRKIMK